MCGELVLTATSVLSCVYVQYRQYQVLYNGSYAVYSRYTKLFKCQVSCTICDTVHLVYFT